MYFSTYVSRSSCTLAHTHLAEDFCQSGKRQSCGVLSFIPLKLCHIAHQVH